MQDETVKTFEDTLLANNLTFIDTYVSWENDTYSMITYKLHEEIEITVYVENSPFKFGEMPLKWDPASSVFHNLIVEYIIIRKNGERIGPWQ